ncbi:MAG: class I SAM-dependent methyltransferase [Ktedonobacterales bacterium]
MASTPANASDSSDIQVRFVTMEQQRRADPADTQFDDQAQQDQQRRADDPRYTEQGFRTRIGFWDGVAAEYDAYRPQPPAMLFDILTQLARAPRPQLVVDLGSGTGLSTLAWAERAEAVIGVEPNAAMRQQAERRRGGQNDISTIAFREGISTATGLPHACADIVTASQALHWMEPTATFAEVARILRPGGIFAAYDYDWPPTVRWQAEQAYKDFIDRYGALTRERALDVNRRAWPKEGHLSRIRASGRFRYVKEITIASREEGDAARFIGLALSYGPLQVLQAGQVTEDELALEAFQATINEAFGGETLPWYFSYRVKLGIL